MPAGMGVVADVGKAVGAKASLDDGENGVAGFRGDPGVDAVGDDVVERVCGRVIIVDGEAVKLDISRADGGSDGIGALDVSLAIIDACETAAGDGLTHREQVEAGAAAEFEDTAVVDGRRGEALEMGQGGDDSGMGVLEGEVAVGDFAGIEHCAGVYCNWRR